MNNILFVIIISIICVSVLLFIIKHFFSKQIEKFYAWILKLLFKSKIVALVITHGGFHIITIALCLLGIYILYSFIKDNNEEKFNQLIYTFYGDTLNNYKQNYLYFKKDISPRQGNIFNKGDIELEYGFIEDKSISSKKYISHVFKNDSSIFDLVSKVEYISVNEKKDTLYNKKKANIVNGYINFVDIKTNHQRYYYTYSKINDTTHIFKRRTNAIDPLKEWKSSNPYHCLWIGLKFKNETQLDSNSIIKIIYNKIEYKDSLKGIRQPITLEKIYPQPTMMNLTEIIYKGKELESVLKQGGIYITGVDPERKREIDRNDIILSVLIGTLAAFILDVIVNMIMKWRNLKTIVRE